MNSIPTVMLQSTDFACGPLVQTVRASTLLTSAGWETDFPRSSPADVHTGGAAITRARCREVATIHRPFF